METENKRISDLNENKMELLKTRMGHLENEYISFLKNKIEEQSKEETQSVENKVDEDTLVSNDHNKELPSEKTQRITIDVSERVETIGEQLYSTFSEIKEAMKNKNLEESKECLEEFRKGVNLIFENQQGFSYQLKKILKEFNDVCDKIRVSRNLGNNYRQCILDNMEILINHIIKMQKKELKKIKANKRTSRNF